MLELFIALSAGLISFLSPCVLPLIPGYISFISGQSLNEILVSKKIYAEVAEKMSSSYSKLKVGQALEDKDLGPVISNRQKQIIQNYLRQHSYLGPPYLISPLFKPFFTRLFYPHCRI